MQMANFYVDQFLRHRKATQQFAALMPEEQYEFKPYEGALSFGQLVAHIAGSGDFLLSFADGIPFVKPETASPTPAEIKAYLAQKTEEQTARIEKLSADPERVVDFRGTPMTVGALLANMREHEAHHKGQLMTYLRCCGVTEKLFYVAR
jgi:uncharacterized damage-inducible protein DinB